MIRVASCLLALAAVASAVWFTVIYLGGFLELSRYERLGLAPLIAGLGAAVLEANRRGRVSRPLTVLGISLLLGWVLFLTLGI